MNIKRFFIVIVLVTVSEFGNGSQIHILYQSIADFYMMSISYIVIYGEHITAALWALLPVRLILMIYYMQFHIKDLNIQR